MKQPTNHAPAELAPNDVLNAQITSLQSNAVLEEVAQHSAEHIVLVNPQRQIVYANASYLVMGKHLEPDEIYGKRFGEHMGCIHAACPENTCGTAEACQMCGAVNAVLKSLNGKVAMQRCSIPIEGNEDPLHLIILTIPVRVNGSTYVLAAFVDDNQVIEHPHTLAEHAFTVQKLAARIEHG